MRHFNLSDWAITHRALVLFMILVLAAAGAYSYFSLGRAEDPSFTIKTMVVNVGWPGATARGGTVAETGVVDVVVAGCGRVAAAGRFFAAGTSAQTASASVHNPTSKNRRSFVSDGSLLPWADILWAPRCPASPLEGRTHARDVTVIHQ